MKRQTFRVSASLTLLALMAILSTASCSVRQTVSLNLDGSGVSTLEVELHPVFMAYYSELASGFNPSFDPKNPRIFDPDALRNHFAANKDLVLESVSSASPDRLSLLFRFSEITDVIKNQDAGIRDVISVSRNGDRRTVKIHLDRRNLRSILRLTPDGNSPLARMLLPPEEQAMSEEDYAGRLAWALEEYAENDDIEKILSGSAVELVVRVKGRIVEQRGGKAYGNSEVRFRIPLVGLFTLEKPLDFSVTYRAASF